jgi:hypothetical protein
MKIRRMTGLLVLASFLVLASGATWIGTSIRSLPALKPATQGFLYPGDWQLSDIRRHEPNVVEFDVYFFEAGDRLESIEAALVEDRVQGAKHTFKFRLQPDYNWFKLTRGDRVARFFLNHAPAGRYTTNGNSQAPTGSIAVGLMDIAPPTTAISQVDDWVADLGDASLPASMKIPSGEPGESAFEETAIAYADWLEGKQGWPSDEVIRADVGAAARMVDEGKARIWCGNISNIYMLVAQRTGLKARPISLMNVRDSRVTTAGHVANETYRPSSRRWQLMDFTLGFLSVSGRHGPLNGLEFHQLMAEHHSDRDALSFETFDPATHSYKSKRWAELPQLTQTMVEGFYGKGAQVFYRFHPNVGKESRTLLVRAVTRLFDTEQIRVFAPNTETLSAVTWYDVHVYSRTLCLAGMVAWLVMAAAWVRSRKPNHLKLVRLNLRPRRRQAVGHASVGAMEVSRHDQERENLPHS